MKNPQNLIHVLSIVVLTMCLAVLASVCGCGGDESEVWPEDFCRSWIVQCQLPTRDLDGAAQKQRAIECYCEVETECRGVFGAGMDEDAFRYELCSEGE